MKARLIPGLLALMAAAPAARAQTAQVFDPSEDPSERPAYIQVQEDFQAWQDAQGTSWRMRWEKETQNVRFLFGGHTDALFRPASEAEFFALARHWLAETHGMHRIDASTLVEDRATFLPLGIAGSTDKVTVQFTQQVNGVPVDHGFTTVLFDTAGRLLSVDTTGLPALAGFDSTPGYDGGEAVDAALATFTSETGLPPTSVEGPKLLIDQLENGKLREPRLAYEVTVQFLGEGVEPEGYHYRFDAHNGALIGSENAIHNFDVSGNVKSMATPGLPPDSAGNPEQALDMHHLQVTSSQGNAVTDSNGNFNIVGASAPLNVTVTYTGPYAATSNQATADYSLTVNLTANSGNNILMNPGSNDLFTAEANAFDWIGQMRDWTRAVNPADATSDFLAPANVNISSTCNAFFNGSSTNYYLSGGGCANTAYSTVVLHEMGHWLNVRYGSGNGPDGFGEGNSDVFATYISDDPIVGIDFCGPGCNVRNANNTRPFCGDCCGGCYGGVHADGEVLMGALWKVRTRLKNTLGSSAGQATANTLFNSWMNAYNDGQIRTIIEDHWLTLDDNDGNINNGTPNYPDIDGGFRDQSFPGFDLAFVLFTNVTALPDVVNGAGPFTVNADMVATFNPPVVNPEIRYIVNGGGAQTVAMSFVGGTTYTGDIPGQAAPATVQYWIRADDSMGNQDKFPKNAPTGGVLSFDIGNKQTFFATDFESGVSGWSHGTYNGTQDDWQLSSQVAGSPNGSYGLSGDPSSAFSGSNIWGNDLGQPGWNGAYQNNIHNYLRSPSIDLTGSTGAKLKLQRWLTVEEGIYDQARIMVNGTQVWTNPANGDLLDNSWNAMEVDISAYDGNPNVVLEFQLQSDAGLVYGGWNIDDVEIETLTGGGGCNSPTTYCTAKQTSSGNTPAIGSLGLPSETSNTFFVTLTDAEPNKNGVMFWGTQPNAAPFKGGTLCVKSPLKRTPILSTDGAGAAQRQVNIDMLMVGTTRYYQWWFRDPALLTFRVGLSDGLDVTFCP